MFLQKGLLFKTLLLLTHDCSSFISCIPSAWHRALLPSFQVCLPLIYLAQELKVKIFSFSCSLLKLISSGKKYVKRIVRFPYHRFKYSRSNIFWVQTMSWWPWGNQESDMELLALWHVFPECTIYFTLLYIVSSIPAFAWTGFCSGSFLWPAADNASSALFNIPCGFCATLLTFYDTLLWQSFF